MNTAVDTFVQELSSVTLEHVFNPYADRCVLHDRSDAPQRRKQNLALSLETAINLNVRTIWIARDLGYRGGRRTGLALTDEVHLDSYSELFRGLRVAKATKGPAVGERTATVIWSMLRRLAEPVFLWNVFPLHPHAPDDPMSNRCHTRRERQACSHFLYEIMDLLQPETIIAIGGDAHRAVDELGVKATQVRHPSYGGQSTFIAQIEQAYALPSIRPADLFTLPA
ncbi:MAG: uracil-DNA glycosylase [Thalassobaculum sp.]